MSLLAILNNVFWILSKVVAWGESKKIFKENESIIALAILKKSQEDIQIALKVETDNITEFNSNGGVVPNDEFTVVSKPTDGPGNP